MKSLSLTAAIASVCMMALSCTNQNEKEWVQAELNRCNEELEACTESLYFRYTVANSLPYVERRVELLEHKDSVLHRLRLITAPTEKHDSLKREFAEWRERYEAFAVRCSDSICRKVDPDEYDDRCEYYESYYSLYDELSVVLIRRIVRYKLKGIS